MIKIENTEVIGWQAAMRGMRNPMNSWDKSDSLIGCNVGNCNSCNFKSDWCGNIPQLSVGENDLDLMKRLVNAGSDHSKFMRMINVTCDITAPLYWWKECDTYKVGTVRDSCSTMHKIHSKEFTLDDFSHEHLVPVHIDILSETVEALNAARELYLSYNEHKEELEAKFDIKDKKDLWWQMIQLLPSSYNQRATLQLNYAVLRNMYHSRRNHKLDEWHIFCDWIESLPYARELITI